MPTISLVSPITSSAISRMLPSIMRRCSRMITNLPTLKCAYSRSRRLSRSSRKSIPRSIPRNSQSITRSSLLKFIVLITKMTTSAPPPMTTSSNSPCQRHLLRKRIKITRSICATSHLSNKGKQRLKKKDSSLYSTRKIASLFRITRSWLMIISVSRRSRRINH